METGFSLVRICAEAVRLHGTDWLLIETHIQRAIAEMTDRERLQLEFQVEQILEFDCLQKNSAFH